MNSVSSRSMCLNIFYLYFLTISNFCLFFFFRFVSVLSFRESLFRGRGGSARKTDSRERRPEPDMIRDDFILSMDCNNGTETEPIIHVLMKRKRRRRRFELSSKQSYCSTGWIPAQGATENEKTCDVEC